MDEAGGGRGGSAGIGGETGAWVYFLGGVLIGFFVFVLC